MADSLVTWASLIAAIGVGLTLLKFYNEFNDRILAAQKESNTKIDALRAEREVAGHNFSIQIAALQGALSLHKEQMAREQREFVTQAMLRDLEDRMEKSVERTVEAINQLTTRIDRALEDRKRERD
jgi:biopolymer transport protein ExbB/TolQ